MNTPKAVKLSGTIRPRWEFCIPSLRTRMNRGTTMASKVIMMVDSTTMNSTALPLKRYFAKP